MSKLMTPRMKKTLCVLISASMVAGLTACGSTKATTVSDNTVSENNKNEAVLNEAISQMSGRNTTDSGKEETVYAFTDASGSLDHVVISNWLKNIDGEKELKDFSELKDIENVKGYETFTQDADGNITWQADGADIYYQGTTDKELPVGVKITYFLDGKETAPEDMLGKSGFVTIRFDYENKATVTAQVGDHTEELPVPFAMMSGMVLPTEHFKNVEINHGEVISEGSNSIVVGVAFPGLQDSLDLQSVKDDLDDDEEDLKEKIDDVDIPDFVEVSANCVDFQLDMTLTIAMSDILSSINTTDEIDLSDIDDKLDELQDATADLKDGVSDLKDGTEDLVDGVWDLKDGTTALYDGTYDLKGGTEDLIDGAHDLKDGTIELVDGAVELDDGAHDLRSGAKKLKNGSGTLKDGLDQLAASVAGLGSSLGGGFDDLLNAFTASENGIFVASDGLDNGLKALDSSYKDFNTLLKTYFNSFESTMMADIQKAQENAATAGVAVTTAKAELDDAEEYAAAQKEALLTLADGGEYTPVVTNLDGEEVIGDSYDGSARSAVEMYNEALEVVADKRAAYASARAEEVSATEKIAQLTALYANYNTGTSFQNPATPYEQKAATATYLLKASDNISGSITALSTVATKLNTGLHTLYNTILATTQGMSSQSAGLPALIAGISKLQKGSSDLYKGTKKLYNGTGDLKEGTEELLDGAHEMDDGADDLVDGAYDLDEGARDLKDGAKQLDDGASDLRDGSYELDDGVGALLDGVNEFDEEGVQKIIDLFGDDVHDVVDRINAISDAGDDYQSFSGIANNTKGSVKFIIKTDAIK